MSEGERYTNWRPNGSNDCLLLFTVAGGGWVSTGGTPVAALPGTLLCYALGAEQVYCTDAATGHWEFFYAHFLPRREWAAAMAWPETTPGLQQVAIRSREGRREIAEAFEETIRRVRRGSPVDFELAHNALFRAILLAEGERPSRDSLDSRIRGAANRLRERIHEPFDLRQVAAESSMSVSRFAHLFREQIGTSPRRYAEEARLHHARFLLESTPLPVGEIAEACGFSDPFYFSNRFRKLHGRSPRAYRRTLRSMSPDPGGSDPIAGPANPG